MSDYSWSRLSNRWGVSILAVLLLVVMLSYTSKVLDRDSAFVRWRPLVQGLVRGEDVYHQGGYPNPPLLGITLYPLSLLPATGGALVWFSLQAAMAAAATLWSIKLAAGPDGRLPGWAVGAIVLLSARPLESDLQHGNVNILIFFLAMAGLWAFASGRDGWAGLAIALAITFKLTPALFLPYFAYKREWRVVGAAVLGLVLFLAVLPGLVLGPLRNLELLAAWADVYVRPYLVDGVVETLQINQSLPGVFYRLFTQSPGIQFADGTVISVNWFELDPKVARRVVGLLLLFLVASLAWICRTDIVDRGDWRLACEYSLVLIGMLFISERSWKHHYVTMVLPYSAVVSYWALRCVTEKTRWCLGTVLLGAFLLMASTSTELGGWLAGGDGHKYAQAYGMFFLSALLMLVTLSAILLWARQERRAPPAGYKSIR